MIDVVFGGAPCQGFSLIGHRALDDPRNRLVREFVRLVADLEAKYFVFENVKGLTLGAHRRFLEEVIEAFSIVGYEVVLPWRVLDAASYGVPQHRERLILLGARKGLRLPNYPKATTGGSDGLPRPPTVREALADLPEAEHFEELIEHDSVTTDAWGTPSAYARALRVRDKGDLSYQRVWSRNILTSSMRTEHTPISRRRFAATLPGEVEPISRFFRLPADGLAHTLRAGTDSARGAFTSPRPIHYSEDRCVTVREMARLHGFPDWFRLHKTKWHGARQVGNAVAPPLARAVATEVATALGANPSRPSINLHLGQQRLLALDMGQAALHFAIPVPIARRDRKSGAKKRRQEDIEAELSLAAHG